MLWCGWNISGWKNDVIKTVPKLQNQGSLDPCQNGEMEKKMPSTEETITKLNISERRSVLLPTWNQGFYIIGFSKATALFRQEPARGLNRATARGWATILLGRLGDFAVESPPQRAAAPLLSSTLWARKSFPLWTVINTSILPRRHVRLISSHSSIDTRKARRNRKCEMTFRFNETLGNPSSQKVLYWTANL